MASINGPNIVFNMQCNCLVVVLSLLLIVILLVIFRRKLNCCRGKTNHNENNVSVAQVQQPDAVIIVSADTEYLDLTNLDPEDGSSYEKTYRKSLGTFLHGAYFKP